MYRCNWLPIITLGWLVLLSGAASAQPPNRAPVPENVPATKVDPTHQPKNQGQPAQTQIAPQPSGRDDDATRNAKDESERTAREKADLAAQQAMASAAERQIRLIVVQNWYLLWNTVFLVITFAATAWAAYAAARAAKAAEQSVSISQKASAVELRPYVTSQSIRTNVILKKEPRTAIGCEISIVLDKFRPNTDARRKIE